MKIELPGSVTWDVKTPDVKPKEGELTAEGKMEAQTRLPEVYSSNALTECLDFYVNGRYDSVTSIPRPYMAATQFIFHVQSQKVAEFLITEENVMNLDDHKFRILRNLAREMFTVASEKSR
jgi:hypothetical protein